MTVAAYIRVSSKGQDHALQRGAIERAAGSRGVDRWYAEKRSAGTLDRPELAALLDALARGELERCYVFRLDRLARSGIADTLAVVERFRAARCELVTVADGFDLRGPFADLIVAVMGWAAQMETLARRERIAARRALAEERGEPWGRPSRLTYAQRNEIAARRLDGETVREIAQAMHVPRATVGRIASRNPPLLDGPRTRRQSCAT